MRPGFFIAKSSLKHSHSQPYGLVGFLCSIGKNPFSVG